MSAPRIALYARREPTTDTASFAACKAAKKNVPSTWKDVVIYANPNGEPIARFPHWSTSKPKFGQHSTTLNSFRYTLVWLSPIV